jgi:hypothetical protein
VYATDDGLANTSITIDIGAFVRGVMMADGSRGPSAFDAPSIQMRVETKRTGEALGEVYFDPTAETAR